MAATGWWPRTPTPSPGSRASGSTSSAFGRHRKFAVAHTIWNTRPADLYGRRKRDRSYTALWGVGALFGGLASASRWTPSRVSPVERTNAAVVTKRELLAPDVVALTLADPDGGLLPSWTPGAHIDVRLPSGRRRQYSLCGPPGRRTDYRIAVRRIADGGGGSIEMHEAYRPGDPLVFEGPRNAFYLGATEREVLFVIGGIGVTPILPMLHAAEQRGIDWRAIYARQQPGIHAVSGRGGVGGPGPGFCVGRRRARPVGGRGRPAGRRRADDGRVRVRADRHAGSGALGPR